MGVGVGGATDDSLGDGLSLALADGDSLGADGRITGVASGSKDGGDGASTADGPGEAHAVERQAEAVGDAQPGPPAIGPQDRP